jgi:hypothetical protein
MEDASQTFPMRFRKICAQLSQCICPHKIKRAGENVISDKYSTIFVHQMKSGGSSIKAIFPDRVRSLNHGILDPQWRSDPRVGHYFKFSIVRNPWDRFVSAYHYLSSLRRQTIDNALQNMPNINPMRDVLTGSLQSRLSYTRTHAGILTIRAQRLLSGKETWSQSSNRHMYSYWHSACPQYSKVIEPSGEMAVDAIYFLEDMETALEDLRDTIGIETDAYRIQNTAPKKHDYREILSKSARDAITAIFFQDIEYFGYSFDDGPGVRPREPMFRNSYRLRVSDADLDYGSQTGPA